MTSRVRGNARVKREEKLGWMALTGWISVNLEIHRLFLLSRLVSRPPSGIRLSPSLRCGRHCPSLSLSHFLAPLRFISLLRSSSPRPYACMHANIYKYKLPFSPSALSKCTHAASQSSIHSIAHINQFPFRKTEPNPMEKEKNNRVCLCPYP